MVVSYTNSHGYIDAYANKPINNMTTNADGGGNGGGGAFFKMFEEKEAEVERDTSISSNPLDDLYPQYNNNNNFYASDNVIKDYIDNSLLLNTEQVACTNITQHLALKSNVQETLKFLNTQAAKTMVNSRKRNYKYQSTPKSESVSPVKQTQGMDTALASINFFESNSSNPQVNFFMRGK